MGGHRTQRGRQCSINVLNQLLRKFGVCTDRFDRKSRIGFANRRQITLT
jgi:hypothetical protein